MARNGLNLIIAGEEDDLVQAGGLDQVLEHRVPGVHGGAGGGVRGAGDDDPDAGEGAQEEVPPARRLRPQAGQARRPGPRRAETGTTRQDKFRYF